MPPKHPDKEIRKLLDEAEDQEWEVVPPTGRGYWKIKCPCDDKHWSTVKISPSNPNYLKELRKKLKRETCWKEVS
ncbi:hypothetical protein Sme01_02640 [Sphaerisporangium melleum]|uniref:Uncharacterized protein n=1 Tax=Sphaerisporangium melleum TaxID=321316 RepID=A0A917QNX6_9ACTN|nr:hypothetical protein [Sphaerisporangium melleum]GGK61028.1 hypothetical protein GCM10007964_00180 [Sphaerisporangium melleum]GII67788.1 hypothetical protein Sme01_02640 [Sphaerisporangium melleum]